MNLKTMVDRRSSGTVLPLLDSLRSTRVAARTELVYR